MDFFFFHWYKRNTSEREKNRVKETISTKVKGKAEHTAKSSKNLRKRKRMHTKQKCMLAMVEAAAATAPATQQRDSQHDPFSEFLAHCARDCMPLTLFISFHFCSVLIDKPMVVVVVVVYTYGIRRISALYICMYVRTYRVQNIMVVLCAMWNQKMLAEHLSNQRFFAYSCFASKFVLSTVIYSLFCIRIRIVYRYRTNTTHNQKRVIFAI